MRAAQARFLAHRAQLGVVAPEWQKMIAYGHGDWEGDRFLTLAHHKLTDTMEIWHELPDRKPVLVMKVPARGFNIYKALDALRRADGRRHSINDVIVQVDRFNAKVQLEQAKKAQAMTDHATEKTRWAIRKDIGRHIAPMTVPRSVAV